MSNYCNQQKQTWGVGSFNTGFSISYWKTWTIIDKFSGMLDITRGQKLYNY